MPPTGHYILIHPLNPKEAIMATATLNPVITSISGKVGRLVFYRRNNETIMRAWILPPNPNSEAQRKNRNLFRQAMISWRALSAEEKTAYNGKGRKLGMTGHNLFISRFMKAQNAENNDNGEYRDGFSRACPSVTAPSHVLSLPGAPYHDDISPFPGGAGVTMPYWRIRFSS